LLDSLDAAAALNVHTPEASARVVRMASILAMSAVAVHAGGERRAMEQPISPNT
jgi:hypothetical protein